MIVKEILSTVQPASPCKSYITWRLLDGSQAQFLWTASCVADGLASWGPWYPVLGDVDWMITKTVLSGATVSSGQVGQGSRAPTRHSDCSCPPPLQPPHTTTTITVNCHILTWSSKTNTINWPIYNGHDTRIKYASLSTWSARCRQKQVICGC